MVGKAGLASGRARSARPTCPRGRHGRGPRGRARRSGCRGRGARGRREVGAGEPHRGGAAVHLLDEGPDGAGVVLGQRHRGVVGGDHEQRPQQRLQRHRPALREQAGGGARFAGLDADQHLLAGLSRSAISSAVIILVRLAIGRRAAPAAPRAPRRCRRRRGRPPRAAASAGLHGGLLGESAAARTACASTGARRAPTASSSLELRPAAALTCSTRAARGLVGRVAIGPEGHRHRRRDQEGQRDRGDRDPALTHPAAGCGSRRSGPRRSCPRSSSEITVKMSKLDSIAT